MWCLYCYVILELIPTFKPLTQGKINIRFRRKSTEKIMCAKKRKWQIWLKEWNPASVQAVLFAILIHFKWVCWYKTILALTWQCFIVDVILPIQLTTHNVQARHCFSPPMARYTVTKPHCLIWSVSKELLQSMVWNLVHVIFLLLFITPSFPFSLVAFEQSQFLIHGNAEKKLNGKWY